MIDSMVGTNRTTGIGITNTYSIGGDMASTISKVNASKNDIADMSSKLQNSMNLLNSLPGKVKSIDNCKFLRGDFVIFSNSMCYNFVFAYNDFAV